MILDHENYNVWIDPVVASSDIKLGSLCNNLYTLLTEMTNQNFVGSDSENDDSLVNNSFTKANIPFEYYITKVNQLL